MCSWENSITINARIQQAAAMVTHKGDRFQQEQHVKLKLYTPENEFPSKLYAA